MIDIHFGKGFLILSDQNGQVYPGWVGDNPPTYPELPEVDFVYQKCLASGMPSERIIDVMLKIFHRQRIIRAGFLSELYLVLGWIGAAGSGKSCGMAGTIIYDYLLAGIPVFSNMDIAVTVKYKKASKTFRTQDLDKASLLNIKDIDTMYRNCCLGVDELNLELSDARRSMSNKSLFFSYALQERRKRHIHFLHTEQSEMHADERVRFQTSLYIQTRDAAYQGGPPQPDELGRKSRWKVYDTSGIYNGEILDGRDPRLVIFEDDFHNTPFWHSFDTDQLQTGVIKPKPVLESDITVVESAGLMALKAQYARGREVVTKYASLGIERANCDELWLELGIENDRGAQTAIGNQLADFNVTKHRDGMGKTFYRFPPKSKIDV